MLSILLDIVGIGILYYILKTIIRIAYNIIFIASKRPYIWILLLVVFGVFLIYLSTLLSWGINVFPAAILFAFIGLYPPKLKNKELQALNREMIDVAYVDMYGIGNGALLYKVGIWMFFISSVISWIVFYAQVIK
jgi:hypothetical protein